MIRATASPHHAPQPRRGVINTARGEFETAIAGEMVRFDTKLSTVAAIEQACGDRAVVAVLNDIIAGRRARDQIPLIAAALTAADPARPDPEAFAASATVGEAEAFVVALVFALGLTVAGERRGGGIEIPLDRSSDGTDGASSPSAA